MRILVDSFAWLEIFQGGKRGEKALKHLETNTGELYTTTENFYEVYYRSAQIYGREKLEQNLATIKNYVTLLPITETTAREAGEIRLEHGLSAVDAFTLAGARMVGAKVLTGDEDFKKFGDEIIFV